MPELPEVEVCARRLRRGALGRRIERAALEGPVPALAGQHIVGVRRIGKQVVIDLEGAHLLLHLGMTGKVVHLPESEPPRRATRASLWLEGGERLDFVDPRRFGELRVATAAEVASTLGRLGPDALEITANFAQPRGGDALAARFVRVGTAIKGALLDQRRLAGVGNIYAAEGLHFAGIHPWLPAHRVTAWAALAEGLHTAMVRSLALEVGDESAPDWLRGEITYLTEGGTGAFRVYGRAGAPCDRCGTAVRRDVQLGRSTFWCPQCQPAP